MKYLRKGLCKTLILISSILIISSRLMAAAAPPNLLYVPTDYPTIEEALSHAVDGYTIVLTPGTYQVNNNLVINKNNISIVSRYLISGDENDIDTTILQGDPTVRLIDGEPGQSANLKLIGLTIRDALKGITFADDYGEVHYCKFYNTQEDAISFDTNAGGAVTHTRVENAGDDAIDIDTRYNGSFLIAYNELINSDDDSIEIHLYNSVSSLNMHHDIHDNLFSGAREDGIQLIDFDADSKRTFDIYRNIFENMRDVGIGSMFEGTAENFEGTTMTERVRIYNNYFYNNGYHITGGDNMIILNNIFEAAGTTAIKRVKGNSIADFNLFYNNSINIEDTLTGGNNLFDVDPQRSSDFTLQQNSPAINAGTQSYTHLSDEVLLIPDNEYAGQNPDMGRHEYELDDSAPLITLTGANPITLNRGDTFTDPGATAWDDQDGNLTTSIKTVSNVNTAVAASYSVNYTVTDSDGNKASMSRSVIVKSNTIVPVLSLIGVNPIVINRGDTFTDPGATALDDLDGNLTQSIKTVANVNTAVAGSYSVNYTVADFDGNTASMSRSVIVGKNSVAPVITLTGANPIYLTVGDTFTDPGATAEDDLDENLSDEIEITSNVNKTVADTYQVIYTVTDSDGNTAWVSREVIVTGEADTPIVETDATVSSSSSSGDATVRTSSSGGGSSNRTVLLLLALAFLFRQYRKGKLI